MNYKDFDLGDWIGHISGVIEDETTLDGNEMRDLVGFLTTLKQEPTTKNDLGVDCISREQALKELKESAEHHANDSREEVLLRRDRDIIRALPPVTPQEPKTGHWIVKEGREQGYDMGGIKTWYIQIMCDKCGFIKTAIEGHTGQYHFCPNCGADMREVEE